MYWIVLGFCLGAIIQGLTYKDAFKIKEKCVKSN